MSIHTSAAWRLVDNFSMPSMASPTEEVVTSASTSESELKIISLRGEENKVEVERMERLEVEGAEVSARGS